MGKSDSFPKVASRQEVLAAGHIVPAEGRCIQCGICSFNCPIGIDVRRHAWLGEPVVEAHCLTCGECVRRCPRGVLHFEQLKIFGGSS
jgi:heterodisulfide reductase subunit C